jgi:hypothetical protein
MNDSNLTDAQTPDVPYRWMDCLVAGLAYRLARIYAPQSEQLSKADYDEAWRYAATQDTEPVPLMLAPNLSTYYRR